MNNRLLLTFVPWLPSCGKQVFFLPDTNLPPSPILGKVDSLLNGIGGFVLGILGLVLAACVAWCLYRILRAIFRKLGQVLYKIDQWFVNVDESLATFKTQLTSANSGIRWLEKAHQRHKEKIEAIEKLLVDLKAHTGFETKEFTGEAQP